MLATAAATGTLVAASLWLFLRHRDTGPQEVPSLNTAAAVARAPAGTDPAGAAPPPLADPPLVAPHHASDSKEPSPRAAATEGAEPLVARSEPRRDPTAEPPTAAKKSRVADEADHDPRPSAADRSEESPLASGDRPPSPAPAEAVTIQSSSAESPEHPLPAPSPDTQARMKIGMDGVVFADTALRHVAAVVQQMTSVPIELDRGGLFRAGVAPDTSVRLELQDATAAQLLDTVAARFGLVVVATADRVMVTAPSADEAVLRTGRMELGRLARSLAERQWLVEMITQLVDPASWQPVGEASVLIEENSLRLTQTATGYRQVQGLLEQLRLARGLPGAGAAAEAGSALQSRSRRAAAGLARSVFNGSGQELPLDRYLSRLAGRAGVEIVLDELSLLRYGVALDTMATGPAGEQTLEAVLTETLKPLGLAWRVLDADLVEVTTPRALAETPDIECYRLARSLDEAGAQRWLRRVQQQISPSSWSGAGGEGVVLFDPAGGCLLVRQTQPLQRAVEAQLSAWQLLD